MILVRRLRPIVLAVILLIWPAGSSLAAIYYYEPFPSGQVGFAQPPVGIRIKTTAGEKIQSARIVLDGVSYTPVWEGTMLAVRPDRPLSPGMHTAEVSVHFEGNWQPLNKTWGFEVTSDALTDFPAPAEEEKIALDEINRWRREADLLPLARDPALSAAAGRHASYTLANPSPGLAAHNEVRGRPGFFGVEPGERAAYFGYPFSYVYEDMYFIPDHRRAVRDWVNSVYHRFPITDPAVHHMGYGFATDGPDAVNVLEIGTTEPVSTGNTAEPMVYPIPGQMGVPTRWDGNELPDPYDPFPGAEAAGYPITVQFPPDTVSSYVEEATLQDADGNPVPFWLLSGRNDPHIVPHIALLPRTDLLPGHRYVVSVRGTAQFKEQGVQRFEKTWWFTTAGRPDEIRRDQNIGILINEEPLTADVQPALKNDRTMVPFRALLETLGASVEWDGQRYNVDARKDDVRIGLKIDNNRGRVGDREVILDAAPFIVNDRTLVPLRFVAESLRFQVQWDGATRTVHISAPVAAAQTAQ